MSAMPQPLKELYWFEDIVAGAPRRCRDDVIRREGPEVARAMGRWFGGPVQPLADDIAGDLATLPAIRMAELFLKLGDKFACGWSPDCDARVFQRYACLAWWLREVAATISPDLVPEEGTIDIPDAAWHGTKDSGWVPVVLVRLWNQERELLGEGSELTVESVTTLVATHPNALAERPGWMALRWAVGTGKLAQVRSVAGNVTTENKNK